MTIASRHARLPTVRSVATAPRVPRLGAYIPWSPASVPGIQPTYVPAVSRSLGKLWQNSAKTTAAVNAGDPIRVATCPYTGQDVAAASDATRMTLVTDGGKYLSNGNGSSSLLFYTFPAFTGPFTVYAAVYLGATGSNLVLMADANPVELKYAGVSPAWFLKNDAGTTAVKSGAMPSGSSVVRIRRDASNVMYIRINGTESTLTAVSGSFTFNQFGGSNFESVYTDAANHIAAVIPINAAVSASDDVQLTGLCTSLLPSTSPGGNAYGLLLGITQ